MRGVLFGFALFVFAVPAGAADMSELSTIKWQMIAQSALDYKDKETSSDLRNCPCPYSLRTGDRQCLGNSAWCRPRGDKPLCYIDEISDEAAEGYRDKPSRATLASSRSVEAATGTMFDCPQDDQAEVSLR